MIVLDVTFIPFGPEAGDNATSIMDDYTLLGPFHLRTTLVYFLQQHHQIYASQTLTSYSLAIAAMMSQIAISFICSYLLSFLSRLLLVLSIVSHASQ